MPSFRPALGALLLGALLPAQTPILLSEYAWQAARITALTPPNFASATLFALPAAHWIPLDLHHDLAANRLWWCDNVGPFRILTSDVTGAGLTTLFTSTMAIRGPVTDRAGRLFFAHGNTLCRTDGNGGNFTVLFTANQTSLLGCPAVDRRNGHVYVGADGDILRFDLDGNERKRIVEGIGYARAIALDVGADRLYWLDAQPASDFLASSRLDGSDRRVVFDNSPAVAQSSGLVQFAFDAATSTLVFADELTGAVRRLDPVTGVVTLLHTVAQPHGPAGVAMVGAPPLEPLLDCNANGVADDQDLADGTSRDCNGNGRPDECESDPCPVRRLFLDHGSNPALPGRAAGCAGNQPFQCFQSFQPFDVAAPGVALAEVGLDGWMANRGLGEGLRVDLFPDDGTGVAPDETRRLSTTSLELLYDPDHVHWVYAPLRVALGPGRHWLRVGGGGPHVQAGVNVAAAGLLPARVRDGAGTWYAAPALAVRLVAADLAASTTTLSLQAAGAVDFVLDAGPTHANQVHWLLGSWSGTQPGLPLGPGVTLPLGLDAYTMFTAQHPNSPILAGFLGNLNAQGLGTARLQLPPGLPAAAVGLVLHHAFFTMGRSSLPTFGSRAVAVQLVP
ncbi:MAG: hypothetical protein JNK49_01940 [Planctomycetes bacterium]|nr:hypothetical protein [Planctomycetota bacterium]